MPARRQVAVSVPRGNNNGVTRNYANAVRDNNAVLGRRDALAPFNRPTRDRQPAHTLPWPVLGTPSTIVRLVLYRGHAVLVTQQSHHDGDAAGRWDDDFSSDGDDCGGGADLGTPNAGCLACVGACDTSVHARKKIRSACPL